MSIRLHSWPVLWLLLLFGVSALTAERGQRAEYVGGTLANGKGAGVFDLSDDVLLLFRGRQWGLKVRYDRINLLEYGQQVNRRYAMAVVISPLLLLSKKRKHFLTVGYTDEDGRQQAAVFRVDKDDIRALLVSLEAKSGRKVQYQDPEARKAGKG